MVEEDEKTGHAAEGTSRKLWNPLVSLTRRSGRRARGGGIEPSDCSFRPAAEAVSLKRRGSSRARSFRGFHRAISHP